MTSFNPSAQRGFVMVAVMWVLLAMVIAVSVFAQWVQSSLQDAYAQQQELNTQIAARSAYSVALHTRLTGQRSAYGVSTIGSDAGANDLSSLFEFDDMGALIIQKDRVAASETFAFDNQVWSFGELNFVVQDVAGLIGLTAIRHQDMVRYLQGANPDSTLRAEQFIDSYLDYQDADSQRRPYGAEAADYRLLQRSVPFNGALRTPLQLRDVLHWEALLKPYTNGDLLYRFRVEGGLFVNVNSASKTVLSLALGNDQRGTALLERRRKEPFTTVSSLYAALGQEESSFTILPDDGIRFWWWNKDKSSAWVHEVHYDGLAAGHAALKQDWMLRVDIPKPLTQQSGLPSPWSLLGAYPDYLGRTAAETD